MKNQITRWVGLLLASAVGLFLSFGVAVAAAGVEVELSEALRFESPEGELVGVSAGRYSLSSDGVATITLTPVGGGAPIQIDADQSDHGATLMEEGVALFVTDEGETHLEWLGTEGNGLLAVGEPTVQERAADDKKRRKTKKKRPRRRGFQVGVCPRGYQIEVTDGEARCLGRTRKSQLRRAGYSRCLEPAVFLEDLEDVDGVDQCELVQLGATQPAVCAPLAKVLGRESGTRVDLTLKVIPEGRDLCMRKTFRMKQTGMLLRSTR